MKGIDALVKRALEFKEKGLSDREIGDELHLSQETVTWLLTRGMKGGEPPKDVKIGWRTIGVYGARLGFVGEALADVIAEESEKSKVEPDTILGVAINGIPFATLVSDNLGKELAIYRPSQERHGRGGAFSSNYAGIEGKKVVIVDDVLSTGETIRGAIADIQEAGGTPVLTVVVVNKTAQDDIQGVPLRALVRARAIA